MNNEAAFHLIATFHAMESAEKGDPWSCQCIACKFTKEFKIPVKKEDGGLAETTMGEALLTSLRSQGYAVSIL
jgi:hypothetical protein